MSSKEGQQSAGQSKYNRRFSVAFKKERVAAIEAKQITISQTSRHYDVSVTSLYKWIYRYSDKIKGTRTVVEMESEGKKTERLLRQVAELERIIGQKQMALDLAERTLALASEEVGYDLKKKYAAPSSSSTAKTSTSTPTP